MNNNKNNKLIIYKDKKGEISLDVKLEKDTIWLSQKQMSVLFDKDVRTINEHTNNIFKEGELNKISVIRKFRITAVDGKNYETLFYNLDVIISVGYRVKSKKGTQFRIWATKTLKEYLLKGYIINQKRLKELKSSQLDEFKQAIGLIKKTIETKQINTNESEGLLKVITEYANTWATLQQYDKDELLAVKTTKVKVALDYKVSQEAVIKLKQELINKKEASQLFGTEREQEALKGIIGSINQSFGGKEIYLNIERKAAHLLYFIIKNHPFIDGNKRIGSLLFIIFLARNKCLFNEKGENRFNNNALVALALLVAESKPGQKDVIVKLISNFISG